MSRYAIGIDLGTTNCALAFCDLDSAEIAHFELHQLTAAGEVAARPTLPSFMLLPSEHELAAAAMELPWSDARNYVVGTLARERGHELPSRLVASAKSWLCHGGVNRRANILPWQGGDADAAAKANADADKRVSPVTASQRYLEHLRDAWDYQNPDAPLAEQNIFLTVPASFDAVARELTVEAAQAAGLEHATLLEEPQAAFYAWLSQSGEQWRSQLSAGDVVVVCDIGGGTTDFSLIEASDDGSGNLELRRIAVGDHILLGGDNMDLTLAHGLSQVLKKDKGKKLNSKQHRALVHSCQHLKEKLLGDDAPEEVSISILGSGSKLIGGSIKTTLTKDLAHQVLVDGFFPKVNKDDAPTERRALGLSELGLPYSSDAGITRHLSGFLSRLDVKPTAILLNGGVMKSPLLRGRLQEVLGSWFPEQPPRVLEGTDFDLAVAHGAAYYGAAREGKGLRIRGGTARSYYIGVESSMPAIPGFDPPINALCVAPQGMEEGSSVEVPGKKLALRVGASTEFRLFAANDRQEDAVGEIIDPEDCELKELAPVEAALDIPKGQDQQAIVPVRLSSHVTEIGTLEIWSHALSSQDKWKLEYSIREEAGEA